MSIESYLSRVALVLASQSPRRAELLHAAGFQFRVQPSSIDETRREAELAEAYVQRLAWQKAHSIESAPDEVVLAADTVVVIDGELLGKPRDQGDARRMLALLSGREHRVLTAVCLRRAEEVAEETAVTQVWFASITDEEIRDSVKTGEPMDKAGAYAIQGMASRWTNRIDGSYSNVVGLPVAVVYRLLRQFQAL